ncbi:fibrillarin-like rRNA/tRNA 2'-O-methyltransferase [Candidatus Woesearchaeota archaeon]|nr:fibrillarin-like rRNA/tRNA 2'-O-methyltransferase [Candidatus Woesearchaeota archaeon]
MGIQPHKFKGVYTAKKGKRIVFVTKNLTPGKTVYGEETYKEGKDEYREWSLTRSKLGAALAKNISQLGIYPGSKVLYLGASTGTTSSHVSDIAGNEGFVFAVDFAPRTTRELVYLCEQRKNMSPILGDARHPEQYVQYVTLVDAVFQDIAQRDQAEIFIKNCNAFLKKGGFGILAVKARSVDVAKKPKQVFNEVRAYLEKNITIVDYRELDPFEKDHCIFVCKKK